VSCKKPARLDLLSLNIQTPTDTCGINPNAQYCSSTSPPPITDELSRWMTEGQWAAVDALATSGVPGFASLTKVRTHWAARTPAPGLTTRAPSAICASRRARPCFVRVFKKLRLPHAACDP
jgi:hypothetical protein